MIDMLKTRSQPNSVKSYGTYPFHNTCTLHVLSLLGVVASVCTALNFGSHLLFSRMFRMLMAKFQTVHLKQFQQLSFIRDSAIREFIETTTATATKTSLQTISLSCLKCLTSCLCCTIWAKYAITRLVRTDLKQREREGEIHCCLSTLSSKPENWSFCVVVLTSTAEK